MYSVVEVESLIYWHSSEESNHRYAAIPNKG